MQLLTEANKEKQNLFSHSKTSDARTKRRVRALNEYKARGVSDGAGFRDRDAVDVGELQNSAQACVAIHESRQPSMNKANSKLENRKYRLR